jgi:hypothetical protein
MNSSGQQKKQQQQEDRLCNLLSSIGHLSEHGEVPGENKAIQLLFFILI